MKYINKNTEKSIAAAIALHHWRDHFKKDGKNFEEICENLNAQEVWKLINSENDLKEKVREALFSEQSGVCCYCIQNLKSRATAIEHFLPKSADKKQNTYNYANLLLSCDGNVGESGEEKKLNVKKGSSWQDMVNTIQDLQSKYGFPIELDVDALKKMNPHQENSLRPKGQVLYKLAPQHCDEYKKSKKDEIINPTRLPDCWNQFLYATNGSIEGVNDLARKTIHILNLNASILQKSRAEQWSKFKKEFNENRIVSEYYQKNDWIGLEKYIQSELEVEINGNLTYPFCIVRRAFLKQKLDETINIIKNQSFH